MKFKTSTSQGKVTTKHICCLSITDRHLSEAGQETLLKTCQARKHPYQIEDAGGGATGCRIYFKSITARYNFRKLVLDKL